MSSAEKGRPVEEPVEPVGAPAPAAPQTDPRLLVAERGFAGYLTELRRRVGSGELGALPVIAALIVIWLVFYLVNDRFLSAKNLSDLSVQIVATGMMSLGIVFVLLLGEIDLSVGSVSGLCSAVLAVLNINNGWNTTLALLTAIACGAAVGTLHGLFFAKVGVPAFVVTMAGLLGWQGLQLAVLGKNGSITFSDDGLLAKLTSTYFTDVAAAYGLALAAVAGYAAAALLGNRRRTAAGLPARSAAEIWLRTGVLAVLAFGVAAVLNQYKGLPLALVVFLAAVVLLDTVLRRTRFGRKVFAVGGSAEAATRAGIEVARVRIAVFATSGAMAAIGGIFATSMIVTASQTSGQSTSVLMNAIAAAVIGGTSLFGGRGSAYSALIGVLVIQSITSGMNLEGIGNSVQFMVTGGVLLFSVVIDSVSRRGRRSHGRA
jgi:D-xylose transport system permease protein